MEGTNGDAKDVDLIDADPPEPRLTLDELVRLAWESEQRKNGVDSAPIVQKKPKKSRALSRVSPKESVFKITAIFTAFALAIVLPLHTLFTADKAKQAQATMEQNGAIGAAAFERAASALADKQFAQADLALARAEQSFAKASETLEDTEQELLGLSMLIPHIGRQVKSAKALLSAGELCAQSAQTLADGMEAVNHRTGGGLATALKSFDRFVGRALPTLQQAHAEMARVDASVLPAEQRERFFHLKTQLAQLTSSLEQFHATVPALLTFLGLNQEQRYLVFFQNNTEMRATGGFWGSVAEADLLDGALTKTHVPPGGTYFMQGQLAAQVAAPQPLQLLRARWELQDANWFPDFPTSAKKALWFYEKGGGPTADGVIAINASFAAKLIDTIGPLALPSGMTIDGENFLFETQNQVEVAYDKEANTPKAFIGELTTALLEKLQTVNGQKLMEVASLFAHGLAVRDIQLYHQNSEVQTALEKNGWTGNLLQSIGDYLAVIHTNVGGGKTDGLIEEHVNMESVAQADGSLLNTLTLTRQNHSLSSALFSGKNNVDFVRFFVPHGSTLLALEGSEAPPTEAFESTEGLNTDMDLSAIEQIQQSPDGVSQGSALGKTVFGAWTQTKPGEVSTLTLRYQTPPLLQQPDKTVWSTLRSWAGIPLPYQHRFTWQAQSGSENRFFHYQLHPGTSWYPRYSTEQNRFTLEARDRDAYFGSILTYANP